MSLIFSLIFTKELNMRFKRRLIAIGAALIFLTLLGACGGGGGGGNIAGVWDNSAWDNGTWGP